MNDCTNNNPSAPFSLHKLVLFSIAGSLLLWSHTVIANGYGWWFYSFSYDGLNTYFGRGSPEQKRKFVDQTMKLVEDDEELITLMTQLIDNGLSYQELGHEDALRVDKVIGWLIRDGDRNVPIIDSRAETSWYFSPYVIHRIQPYMSQNGNRILQMFKFGRAYGDREPRTRCLGEGDAWTCWDDAYVIMSPNEVKSFSREISSLINLLKNTSLWEDYAVREELKDFDQSLYRVAKESRAMYFWATD